MMNVMRDYIKPNAFSDWAYVWSILHLFCATISLGIAFDLKKEGSEKFICHVAEHKKQIDDLCFSRYQQNFPVPFYMFMILSTWLPVVTALIYSFAVQKRVKEVESRNRTESEDEVEDQARIRGTFYVFYFYFSHLIIRFLSGILFTLLQHAVFFPNGFESEFRCNISKAMLTSKNAADISFSHLNSTFVACENVTASHEQLCWTVLSALNLGFTLPILFEIYRLLTTDWRSDTEFIIVFLSGKQYIFPRVDPTSVDDCIEYYKRQILRPSRPKTTPKDLYVHPIIQTKQAKLRFSKNMERQDIFNVFMKVPSDSVCLKDVEDLFHLGQDTKGNVPLRILAVGRPGIGKTVLTDKIMRDWANGINEVYCGKIAILFKLRWFNSDEMKHVNLKTFLRYGAGLSNKKFEKIYEYLIENPEKAFLIFDGLDESNCNVGCLDELQPPDDPNVCMSATSLFIKLLSGEFLQGATVLVTSRPTANEFYSCFTFDRNVEITGFTSVKIEEYVRKFCEGQNKSDLHPKVWNHIKSSSDLLHLCYIPVNCNIVTSILFECVSVSDPGNDAGDIPTTLTEIYLAAITHFVKHHSKMDNASYEKTMKKLHLLAFRGITDGRLVFDNELFDEQMKNSGLLSSLSNPYSLVQIQYCFIHLTIQEFLAARYVTEKFTSEEIQKFIASHIHSGKWHLVLQFIAGLLRKKILVHGDTCYTDCVMAFAGSVVVMYGQLSRSRFVLKCLREFGDEIIVRKVCAPETTDDEEDISDGASIQQGSSLSLSRLASCNWAAATRVLMYKASQRPKL